MVSRLRRNEPPLLPNSIQPIDESGNFLEPDVTKLTLDNIYRVRIWWGKYKNSLLLKANHRYITTILSWDSTKTNNIAKLQAAELVKQKRIANSEVWPEQQTQISKPVPDKTTTILDSIKGITMAEIQSIVDQLIRNALQNSSTIEKGTSQTTDSTSEQQRLFARMKEIAGRRINPRTRMTEDEKETILKARTLGWSYDYISTLLDRNKSSVRDFIKRNTK